MDDKMGQIINLLTIGVKICTILHSFHLTKKGGI
jgi:hypothetical protein